MDYALRLANQLSGHLRALRKQRGLTQAQLGAKLGIGQVRVAEIEARPGSVSIDQLLRVLSVLGASMLLRDAQGHGKATPSDRLTTLPTGAKSTPKISKTRPARGKPAQSEAVIIPSSKGSW